MCIRDSANIVVPAEIEKERVQTLAEAEAERIRRIKQGEADGVRAVMEAEAAGYLASLTQRAAGLGSMLNNTNGNAELAALMMLVDQMPQLVAEQVKAISELKIDNITVWDSGTKENGKNSTADFVSGLMGSLPPLHQLAGSVGVKLPEFLGEMNDEELGARVRAAAEADPASATASIASPEWPEGTDG